MPASARRIVRTTLGVATIGAAAFGFFVGDDPRWFAASGLLGAIWWLWDTLVERVFAPLGHFAFRMLSGDVGLPSPNLRPTALETIGLLESRLERSVSAEADIQAALRLADLYRAVLRDPVRAEALIGMMRQRYPGRPELESYSGAAGARDEAPPRSGSQYIADNPARIRRPITDPP